MHPDPILPVSLPVLPAGSPLLDITLLLPGVLGDAPNAALQCLLPGPRRCSARVLQPVILTPQPGRVQVVHLVRFGGGVSGPSLLHSALSRVYFCSYAHTHPYCPRW